MEQRALRFETLGDALAEAHRLRALGYDRAGAWTLGQACWHLAVPMAACIDQPLDWRPPWAVQLIARLLFKRKLLAGAPIPRGVKAPPPLVPDESVTDADGLAQLEQAAARFEAHDGPLHAHPIFGPLDKPQWARFHASHAAHHLGFLIPKK